MRTTLIIVISVLSAGKGRQVHAANTVLYENEHVSAIETSVVPGERTTLSAQAPYVLFALTAFTGTLTMQDGSPRALQCAVEGVEWFDRTAQAFQNTGSHTARFLIVEIRKPQPSGDFGVAPNDGTKIAPE
jgi:hypothetical protein